MTTRDENAPGWEPRAQGQTYQRSGEFNLDTKVPLRPISPKSKRAAVLRCFLERGAAGLNCFEAVRLAHDYVLRTTVSECKRYHGIDFLKRYEQVPGHAGSRVDCIRYTLSPDGAAKARELLGDA